MSDDEAYLEFKMGDEEPNPWDQDRNPWADHEEQDLGVTQDFSSPQAPQASRVRHSRDPSLEEQDLGLAQPDYSFTRNPYGIDNTGKYSMDDLSNPFVDSLPSAKTSNAKSTQHADPVLSHPTEVSTDKDKNHDTNAKAEEIPTPDVKSLKLESPLESPHDTPPPYEPASQEHSSTLGTSQPQTPSKSAASDAKDSPRSVHFSESTEDVSKAPMGHKRGGSHFEYHQDSEGNVEKRHIENESGLPVNEDHDLTDDSWEPMPTVGSYEVYDDKNNLLQEIENEGDTGAKDAAASGYTRVSNNDDTASITSLDDKTDFLFDQHKPTDEVNSDFQMAATKNMLTDEQRIAYAGLFRLTLAEIANKVRTHGSNSSVEVEALQKWGSKIVLRLYNHLGLSNEEQLMIESLATHNLQAEDLTPCLKRLQKVKPNGEIDVYQPDATTKVTNKQETVDGNTKTENINVTEEPVYDDEVDADELHEDLPKSSEIAEGMEVDVKWTLMCDLFLILLAEGSYDSRSRTALMIIADKLGIASNEVAQFERKVTDVLQIDDSANQDWTEEDIIENRRRKALRKKYAYVGLATVGGGLVIGLSGGLLAPVVGAGLAGALGTIGISGTAGFLAGAGGTALITTASTAVGATVGSRAMLKRAGHVKTFEFRPIFNNNRVNLIITVSGWMTGKYDDVRLPFSTIDPLMGDVLSVHWEPEMMRSLGQTINILATEALAFGVQQILAATIFTVLMSALTAPMWLAKLSYLVDNPWSVSLDRAWSAGFILADTLMNRKLGQRPATLVGYGLGARVIYSCLTELARKNQFGLVQDVFLFGTPVFYNKKMFTKARSVVSGRYVNGYSRNDWILAFLFPAAKRYGMVIGLDSIPEKETEDLQIENMDVSDIVEGHMQYRDKMPTLLAKCGWSVVSEEFEEIEDPDPDRLREKQRNLLHELDTVEKPKKSGFFSSWNFDWMQRAKSKTADEGSPGRDGSKSEGDDVFGDGSGVLFDVEALRNEMETMKPRMVFEEEEMPLPEHDETNMPAEFDEIDETEPIKPQSAANYDDPSSPKPMSAASFRRFIPGLKSNEPKPQDKQPQMQFEDLE